IDRDGRFPIKQEKNEHREQYPDHGKDAPNNFQNRFHAHRILLVLVFGSDDLHNFNYSSYDKNENSDEKNYAKPVHRPMERLYE
ncbi:MAG: hypothetical protein II102_01990, partial [Bacteroidales bacterium]|nr:hypothetical protein [Bacteroidales bacterium]